MGRMDKAETGGNQREPIRESQGLQEDSGNEEKAGRFFLRTSRQPVSYFSPPELACSQFLLFLSARLVLFCDRSPTKLMHVTRAHESGPG